MPKILFLRVKGELHANLAALAKAQNKTINAVAVDMLTAAIPGAQEICDHSPGISGHIAPTPSDKPKGKGRRR